MKTPIQTKPNRPERITLWAGACAAALLSALPLSAPSAAPAEPAAAEGLYDANCTKCHGTEVYTRDDRMINSLSGLESQVRRCESSLELRWFDDQIMDVTGLLNDRYYHFKP
ncbi:MULTISPECIES: cytochrome c [Thiorhodovibrio]|uniref:cytochrome c n=1 Tax=Thiorhodovibrio TaxID=61593 RepID=UPI001F5C1EA5|nr:MULTISPECIES: cytochrome c [Thiorhodovibrio]WPL12770.1 Green heme protein [Thiorhodovibrio litoralis]